MADNNTFSLGTKGLVGISQCLNSSQKSHFVFEDKHSEVISRIGVAAALPKILQYQLPCPPETSRIESLRDLLRVNKNQQSVVYTYKNSLISSNGNRLP